MLIKCCFVLLFICLNIWHLAVGQTVKESVPSYFGLQVKPIFPTRFIGEPNTTIETDNFTTQFNQSLGYSFGFNVRAGLTKFLALETGINLTQRNFTLDMSYPDSSLTESNTLSFVTYEIPVNALVYIRLADKWYMNTAVGAALTYNPTNVGTVTDTRSSYYFRHSGLAKKLNGELNADIGFEFRTKKSGFFYLGGNARVPFAPVFYLKSELFMEGVHIQNDPQNDGRIDGSYLAIQFKYFFPIIKSKGSPFKDGPIEQ